MRHKHVRWAFLAAVAAIVVFTVASGPSRAAVLPQAYWSFDEGSGLTVTDSVNGNVGTFYESTTPSANGPQFSSSVPTEIGTGYSVVFDGINDHVLVPDSPSVSPTGDLTLTAWISLSPNFSSTGNLFAKTSNSAYRWRLNSNGQLWALLNEGTGLEIFNSGYLAPSDTDWHHTALTVNFADNKVRFYFDGDLKSTMNMNSTTHIQDTTGALEIGAYSSSGTEGFDGNLDDMAIWDQALADWQIAGLADGIWSPSNVPVPEPSALLIWSLLAGLGIGPGWWRRKR